MLPLEIVIVGGLIFYFVVKEVLYHSRRIKRAERSKQALKDDRPKYFH